MRSPRNEEVSLLRTEVIERRSPASGHAILRLRPEVRVAARAGQFAMIRVPGEPRVFLGRPMSIMGAGDSIELLVQEVGKGTRALAALRAGDRLDMVAPLGRPFPDPVPGVTDVLIGGGVGAAPLLLMAREAMTAGRRVTFVYGGRSAGDLVLAREAAEVSSLVPVTEDGSAGEMGLATRPLPAILGAAGPARVVACGPVRMMAAAARIASEAGAGCVACLEALMACGVGACLGCAVPARAGGYIHVCTDGPPVDAALVEWEGLVAAAP